MKSVKGRSRKTLPFVLAVFLISLVLAVFFSPLGSDSPDGLGKIARDLGFVKIIENRKPVWKGSFAPDYVADGTGSRWTRRAVAGIGGTILVFITCTGAMFLIKKSRRGSGSTMDLTD